MPKDDAMLTQRFTLVTLITTVVAIALNVGLYAIGRATGAALKIDPALGQADHAIILGDVVWKTAVPLALGAVVLALIARRSRRWTTIVIVAGAALDALSIPFVFTGAHDTMTGVLLAGMHTVGGVAYVVIGTRAHRDLARGIRESAVRTRVSAP